MTTWVLVANAGRARLFEAARRDGVMSEVGAFVHPEARLPGRAFTTGRGPEAQESARPGGHGIAPRTTLEEKIDAEFADELALLLEEGRVHGRFDDLVLIAEPRFLGRLRAALPHELAKRVAHTVDKDVTRATAEQIRALLDANR